MNKCVGCGAILQDKNPKKEGFTLDLNNNTCQRCFRIKNYNDYKHIVKDNNEFINILKNINQTKDLVVLVVDLFNFNNKLNDIKKYINNDVLLVLTKRDILPLSIYDENIKNYFNKLDLNILDIVIISSNKNQNFDELYKKINLYKKSKNVYVIGYTNAGKSSMINKFIYNYSNISSDITTSILPSTTINSIEIKVNDDLTLIDTPGLLDDKDIINFINVKLLKKIIPSKELKPITYQLKTDQSINIDDLLIVNCPRQTNITIYASNKLKINRKYKYFSNDKLEKHVINISKGEDLVIQGLCFIKFATNSNIVLYTVPNVRVYIRKSLI